MNRGRRRFLSFLAIPALPTIAAAQAAPVPSHNPSSLEATQFGLRPGSSDDQSRVLQRAIDESARMRVP